MLNSMLPASKFLTIITVDVTLFDDPVFEFTTLYRKNVDEIDTWIPIDYSSIDLPIFGIHLMLIQSLLILW